MANLQKKINTKTLIVYYLVIVVLVVATIAIYFYYIKPKPDSNDYNNLDFQAYKQMVVDCSVATIGGVNTSDKDLYKVWSEAQKKHEEITVAC